VADIVVFTDNITDLSNEDGYQFEFVCERCGNGYRSPFQTDKSAKGRGLLRAASSLFGGRLSRLSSAADGLDRGTNSAEKDKAMRAAGEKVKDHFRQCRACGSWVCFDVCWNKDIGQCLSCSPAVEEELSKAQAAAQIEQIQEKVKTVDWTADLDVATRTKVECPSCHAKVPGGKFCEECGAKLEASRVCPDCGAKCDDGKKFCAECGHKFETA
jgi:hypothetical protein